eukprot:2919841-Rhodomonas_salina.1
MVPLSESSPVSPPREGHCCLSRSTRSNLNAVPRLAAPSHAGHGPLPGSRRVPVGSGLRLCSGRGGGAQWGGSGPGVPGPDPVPVAFCRSSAPSRLVARATALLPGPCTWTT